MVVGPLMQGFVLIGIIFLYSKGMISIINDYYRNEFQRKLQTNDTTLNRPNYDVEQFDDLFGVESLMDKIEIVAETQEAYKNGQEFCYAPKNLAYFMNLIGHNSKELKPICKVE